MAPSAVNNQPWYFVVVQSSSQMEKLRGIFADVSTDIKKDLQERFPNNPEVIGETMGFLKGLGGAPVCVLAFMLKPSDDHNIIAVESVSAAIENLCLMAFDYGIGTCWMTAPLTTGFGPVLQKEFAPEAGNFVAAITLGYPEFTPQAPKRKSGRFKIV